MTNRINKLFTNKQQGILNVYFTAGFPTLDDTMTIAEELDKAGADIIEIGIPYSDPVADGPVIQGSNKVAIDNGMTLKKLFEQLNHLRESVNVPVVLMGYFNTVLQYGVEDFCAACEQVGIDGVILPDLPLDVYEEQYATLFQQHGLETIFLITPQTSESRIQEIDKLSNAFIYMVSSASVTGANKSMNDKQKAYFERVNAMKLTNPRLIGFGISDNQSFNQACQYAQGAIIGSAFIKTIANSNNLETDIQQFVQSIVPNQL